MSRSATSSRTARRLGYTTKLIDFDSSYIVGNPPPPDEIVGTMNYYSPELVRYIQGSAAPGELTEASDIFALGLVYAEYLTGAMPPFDPAHHEAAIAVLHGQPLKLGPSRTPTRSSTSSRRCSCATRRRARAWARCTRH